MAFIVILEYMWSSAGAYQVFTKYVEFLKELVKGLKVFKASAGEIKDKHAEFLFF